MKKKPEWLKGFEKKSREAKEASAKIFSQAKEKAGKVDQQYHLGKAVKESAKELKAKVAQARDEYKLDEKFELGKQQLVDTYNSVRESETFKGVEAYAGKTKAEVDRAVISPIKSELSKRGGAEKIEKLTITAASGYGVARAYLKPYYAPDTPEELLLATKEELLYINACILQVSRSDAEKLAEKLGKAVTSQLAGAAAAGGLLSLVSSFGAAGTGTAIASLSGAAANSATLAWVGSLFSGGMAAGAAMTGGLGVAVGFGVYVLLGSEARNFVDLSETEKRIVESTGLLIAGINQTLKGSSSRLGVDEAESFLINNLRPLHALMVESAEEISENLDTKNKIAFKQHAIYDFEHSVIDGFQHFVAAEKVARRVKYPAYAISGVLYALMTQSVLDDNRETRLVLAALRRSKSDWEHASEYELGDALSEYKPEELKGLVSNVKGIYHELLFVDDYNATHTDTYAVVHEATNYPGSDVEIYSLDDQKLIHSYQFKATDSEQLIHDHFEKYPGIDVIATEELASGNLARVEGSGYLNENITQDVGGVIEELSEDASAGEDMESPIGDRVFESAGLTGLAAAGFEAIQVLHGKRKISDVANEGMRGAVVAGTSTALVAYLFG